MRLTVLLAVCLAALASSAIAVNAAGPRPTPSPHLARRVIHHGAVYPRSPRPQPQGGVLPGLLGGTSSSGGSSSSDSTGGVDTNSGSDSSKEGTTSTSSTAAPSSSTTAKTASTSTAAPTSTTTAPTSTSVFTTATTSATGGATSVVELTSTISASASTSTDSGAAATSAAAGSSDSDNTGSSHTGLIVGVSVVGGVALLGALIFLYMKFGGRRFSDFQDDDADIKWPELKHDDNAAAMQPLPARRTGGAGFDMGDESDGHGAREAEDAHSLNDYGGKGAASSTALTGAPMSHAGYGYDDAATGYAATTAGASTQSPYYDPYGQYSATGHDNSGQHAYYGDQQQQAHYGGGPPSYAAGGYGQSADAGMYDNNGGYASHSTHTSPAVQPYRVGGHMPGSHF